MVVRLLVRASVLIAIAVVLEGAIFFYTGNREAWRRSYLAAWRVKHEHLVGPGENRLIVAGGSNVAFGIDSSELQSATRRETINMGLHAGLGLLSMLNEIEAGVRSGDTVILIPEYEHFYGDTMNGQVEAAYLVRYEPSALRYFSSWRQLRPLVLNAHIITRATTFDLLDKMKMRTHTGEAGPVSTVYRPVSTVYRKAAFDAHGDMVAHLSEAPEPERVAATNDRITGAFNQEAIAAITRCASTGTARGGEFVLIYPPVSATYWTVNADLISEVAARLAADWVRTTPADWIFDDRMFYDTAYHLNREGRELRTRKLLNVLQDGLKLADTDRRSPRPAASSFLPGRNAPTAERFLACRDAVLCQHSQTIGTIRTYVELATSG
jgi:hypothetical protein